MSNDKDEGNALLVHSHVFGIKVRTNGHLHYLDENLVMYPCGHNTVIYNTENRTQTLIHGALPAPNKDGEPEFASEGITAMAVTANRRTIALAERGAVGLYDVQTLRRRRVLSYADLGSQELRTVAFSSDGKTVLMVGGAPDWTMVMYTIDRIPKVAAAIKLESAAPGVDGKTPAGADKNQTVSIEVRQADFNPSDASTVCVSGNGVLKIFKLSEGAFKPVPLTFKREGLSMDCSAHVWLPDESLAVATTQGEIILFTCYEFNCILSPADGEPVHCLQPYSKGFLVGGAGGSLRVFDRTSEARYKCTQAYAIAPPPSSSTKKAAGAAAAAAAAAAGGGAGGIARIAVAPSEETLACSTTDHQTYTFALGSTEMLLRSGGGGGGGGEGGEGLFEYLTGSPVHGLGRRSGSAAINAMDVCLWKPLLATCGRDHTVRIWNYADRAVELTMDFEADEPLAVALHPSGLFAAVGFASHVRMVSVLLGELLKVKDIPVKGCRICKFAAGGHALALVNNSAVQIVDAYTGSVKCQLRGHQQAVKCVAWCDRDRKLVTVGRDGNALLWDARNGARLEESMQPRTAFETACVFGDAASPASRCFAYAANDRTIRAFVAASMTPEIQVEADVDVGCMASTTNGRALLVGTGGENRPSVVRSLLLKDGRFPGKTAGQLAAEAAAAEAESADNTGAGGGPGSSVAGTRAAAQAAAEVNAFTKAEPWSGVAFQEVVAHSSGMTAMALSSDGATLFTGGEDGSICVFEVREVDGRGVVRLENRAKATAQSAQSAQSNANSKKDAAGGGGGGGGGGGVCEEVLVPKEALLAAKRSTEALKGKVAELKSSNAQQLRQKDLGHKGKVAGISDKFTGELGAERRRYADLVAQKARAEAAFEAKLETLRAANAAELKERRETYRVKIETERGRKDELEKERQRQAAEWAASQAETEAAQAAELAKLEAEYSAKAAAEAAGQVALQREKAEQERAWGLEEGQMELDCDLEVEAIKTRFEVRLKTEQDTTQRLKAEHLAMKKEYQKLNKEVKDQEEETKQLAVLEKQLREVCRGLEKDIQGHKIEVQERDETISEKDKRIYELKKKNQELEKFKFVLDYKIKELKRQIEPRENEIADMRTQVEEMDLELEQYHKSNGALDLMIGELRLKMGGLQRELVKHKDGLEAAHVVLTKFRRDLMARCGSDKVLGSFKPLKAAIRSLFAEYVQEAGSEQAAAPLDPQAEYNREREHLERGVEGLKTRIAKSLKVIEADHARLTREGVNLTEEMNLLRREAKLLRRQQKSLDLEAESLMGVRRSGAMPSAVPAPASAEAQRELEMQESQLVALENRARELQVLLGT